MKIDSMILAKFYNDIENVNHYKVDGDDCYYKDKLIGEIKAEYDEIKGLNIYFKPIRSISTINITFKKEK